MPADLTTSVNADIATAAAFFVVNRKTIGAWISSKDGTPKMGFWKDGRNVIIGMKHAEDRWVELEVRAKRMTKVVARERFQEMWRAHLQVRSDLAGLRREVEELRRRVGRPAEASVPASVPRQEVAA